MKYIVMIVLILIFLFIAMMIKYVLVAEKNQKDSLVDMLVNSIDFIGIIEEYDKKENISMSLSIYMIDYNIFEKEYKKKIIELFERDIDKGLYDYFVDHTPDDIKKLFDRNVIKSAVHKFVDSTRMEDNIAFIFTDNINSGINLANKHEEDAIEYHKQFGEERPGDPELHSKEPNNDGYSEADSPEKTLEELISTGTVEEFTDTLKEI